MTRIIVIGTDTKDVTKNKENSIARAFSAIIQAMKNGEETRLFICSPEGTCEFANDRRSPTTECARQVLSYEIRKESGLGLLLFDVSSCKYGSLKPSAGFLVWLEYFRTIQPDKDPEWLDLEMVVTEFLLGDKKGLCWSGLVPPDDYKVSTLAKERWEEVMGRFRHDERNWRRGT